MQSFTRQPRKWTLVEDQKLREEVEAQLAGGDVKDWCSIAANLPGRTNKDCRKRWHNSVAGGLKKGQWSKSEDQLLSRGVDQYGQRWTLVAKCVGSRSADQCAKRWQQSLDPGLDRSEWRDVEDRMLIEATQRLGRHWKDIQCEHFPGRSKNCIKNRYTVLVRRYQNQDITLPSAPSSPSESLTPMSSYQDDDDYLSFAPGVYDDLLLSQTHATSSESHRSWSSLENVAYSPWPSPQAHSMSAAMTSPESTRTTSMPQFAYTQPQPLGSNIPPVSGSYNWTTSMHPSPSMHAIAPVTCTSMSNLSFHCYDNYPLPQQPIMGYNPAYTASSVRPTYTTMANWSATHMPRQRASTELQQSHDLRTQSSYSDPRHPHNLMYQY